MSEVNGLDGYVKDSLANLAGSSIVPSEYKILVRPVILEEQLEKKTSGASIIQLDSFVKKVEGASHTIVTEQGKIHMVQAISVGGRAGNISPGDMLKIASAMPEDILDPMLSTIAKEPVGLISDNVVIAIIKSKDEVESKVKDYNSTVVV